MAKEAPIISKTLCPKWWFLCKTNTIKGPIRYSWKSALKYHPLGMQIVLIGDQLLMSKIFVHQLEHDSVCSCAIWLKTGPLDVSGHNMYRQVDPMIRGTILIIRWLMRSKYCNFPFDSSSFGRRKDVRINPDKAK